MADNGAILDRLNEEAFNRGNLDVIDELVSEDSVEHNPMPGMSPDREGLKQTVTALREGFSDFSTTVEDQIVAGDKVVERWKSGGTHDGEYMGIPPTGNRVIVEGMDISRIEDGKIVEHWTQVDALALMQQLGVIPEEAPATS